MENETHQVKYTERPEARAISGHPHTTAETVKREHKNGNGHKARITPALQMTRPF
jgi:hypothetical protein